MRTILTHRFAPAAAAALLAACNWLTPTAAAAESRTLDRPMRIVVRTKAGQTLEGRLTAYSPQGFSVSDAEDRMHELRWDELPAARVYVIHEALLPPRDAEAWLALGQRLQSLPDGQVDAERALRRAERLDPALAPRIERIRRGEPDPPAETAQSQPAAPDEPETGTEPPTGPMTAGEVQAQFWGELTPEQQAETIAQLKTFAEQGLRQINVPMRLLETQYFLFYTDISHDEALKWGRLLDRMYARLSELFAVPKGQNIWRGKCLILVFAQEQNYHAFEGQVHGSSSAGTAGRCWSFGSGEVHVTFYRQPDEMVFAHVLVHEAVHGFLHRYRSPARIPSWINEGLAEVIAGELVPGTGMLEQRARVAEAGLRRFKSLGQFFVDGQIAGWQYGVASGLSAFMIRENKAGYVAFINGIKSGQPWPQSLEQNYGVSLERLVAVYGRTQGVEHLRP